jgi:TorA maturation chaperone TorD
MNADLAFRRAQVYRFLSDAFLYPNENWCDDLPLLRAILYDLECFPADLPIQPVTLASLQADYRRTFGVAGSLCYETEYGLPHEYGQSQELADINGFYRAFGFTIGGQVRERPDHVAVELEFMSILALKEAYTANNGPVEHFEVCLDAERTFLGDHLGRWIDLFAQSVALNAGGGPYQALARFCTLFVSADAARLGVRLERQQLADVSHTPLDPDFSCQSCPVAEECDRVMER